MAIGPKQIAARGSASRAAMFSAAAWMRRGLASSLMRGLSRDSLSTISAVRSVLPPSITMSS
ncbi:MAG: hypothetical protein HC850_13995 [Rhodomicrobium sp.]|nr:hypothetical protein [Rhodomicrobium sp.]